MKLTSKLEHTSRSNFLLLGAQSKIRLSGLNISVPLADTIGGIRVPGLFPLYPQLPPGVRGRHSPYPGAAISGFSIKEA